MRLLVYVLFLSIIFLACSNDNTEKVTPEGVLSVQQLEDCLLDCFIAEADIEMRKKESLGFSDSLVRNYYHGIFEKYGTSRKKLEESLEYYSSETEVINSVYANVLSKLSKLQGKEDEE